MCQFTFYLSHILNLKNFSKISLAVAYVKPKIKVDPPDGFIRGIHFYAHWVM